MTDIREELMPRSKSLIHLSALVAFIALASGTSATAQDAKTVAGDAQSKLKKIQEVLAESKDAPNLKQLRIDGFTENAGKVVVTGVYLDAGKKPGKKEDETSDARFGAAAKQAILKHLKVEKEVPFDWSNVDVYGAVDAEGKPLGDDPPHIVLQTAANAAGAAGTRSDPHPADRVWLTGASFGPGGELVLAGYRDKDTAVENWLTANGAKALAEFPAYKKKGEKPSAAFPNVSFAGLTKFDKWPLAVGEAQKILAAAKDTAALQRTRVDRIYLEYKSAAPRLVISGVRVGEDKLTDDSIKSKLEALWPDVISTIAAAPSPDIVNDLVDPAPAVQAEVSAVRLLDGIRVDPGAKFDANGDILLAGLRPDLTPEKRTKLSEVFQAVVKKRAAKGDAAARRYGLLATSKVSPEAMKPIALTDLQNDLRQWAIKNRDDIRFRRLFFVTDPKSLEPQYYTEAKGGHGLVLVYQATSVEDLAAVKEAFNGAFERHFASGDALKPPSAAPSSDPLPKTSDPPKGEPTVVKEPLLPGLTAELRKIMAAGWDQPREKNPWYGVMIARGYFDDNDQYRLAGFVDRDGQNADLQKLLERLKGGARWKPYFLDENQKEQAVVAPKLPTLSFTQMMDRVKRVTPAYTEFDGVRIEDAYYDENLRLVFKAHAVGRVTPDVVGKLADLLVKDAKYAPRVATVEQPTKPGATRLPPKVSVGIRPVSGPPYPGEWIEQFSLGFGAQLLAKAESDKTQMEKAKEWLDLGLLHYPNVSGVWFLSAYYNHLKGDAELVERDLKRVVDLEVLRFDGDYQRKTRYEEAKVLQGPKRIKLEDLWLIRYREVKDGAPPITLAGK